MMHKISLHKNIKGLLGPFILVSFFMTAVFAPWIAPFDLKTLDNPFLSPGNGHFLGTDDIGQDIFSELIFSTRISLLVGLAAAFLATVLGGFIGTVSGFFRKIIDDILMRITDIFLLIPGLPLIIILSAYLGPGTGKIIIVISLLSWPGTARVVRSRVLQICEADFVTSSKSLGAGNFHIMFRHILPNTLEILFAKGSLAVAGAMLTEAGISFLGLGDPVHKSWGMMLNDAFLNGGVVSGSFWWYLPPIFCICLAVLGFTLSGSAFLHKDDENCFIQSGQPCQPGQQPGQSGRLNGFISKKPKIDFKKNNLLFVNGLNVKFQNKDHSILQVLDDINFGINKNEKIALIGETGSGKSVLLLAMLRLLPPGADVSGKVIFKNKNIFDFSDEKMRRLRAHKIAYIPQGTGNALNPVQKIVFQVAESFRMHPMHPMSLGLKKKDAVKKAVALLDIMGIKNAEKRAFDYPHHYSGGMKQRALVAMALAGQAELLLADEPTKGLDSNRREDILNIFLNLKKKAILAVTHDLLFAEKFADRIAVMYASRLVEIAPKESFFSNPLHPLSRAMLAAVPCRGLQVLTRFASTQNRSGIQGCNFRSNCSNAFDRCIKPPPFFNVNSHQVRCWLYAS